MAKGRMLCADGKPVMFGETLYGGDGRDWMIVGIAGKWSYDVYGLHVAHDGNSAPVSSSGVYGSQPFFRYRSKSKEFLCKRFQLRLSTI